MIETLMSGQGQRMQNLVADMLAGLEPIEYPLRRERIDMRVLLERIGEHRRILGGAG